MGIKVFRIVLDGVVHEVEVEEIRKEEQRGEGRRNTAADTAAGSAPGAAPGGEAPGREAPVSNSSQHRPLKAAGEAAVPKGAGGEMITAPLQGTVLAVAVSEGQAGKCGEVLAVIEAMKMENEIIAPRDCTVKSIETTKGASVAAGDPLLYIS